MLQPGLTLAFACALLAADARAAQSSSYQKDNGGRRPDRAASGKRQEFPLKVTEVKFNVPCGVSYDPAAPVEVTMKLQNRQKKAVALERGRWCVRRTRALVGDPMSKWDSLYSYLEEVGSGFFTPLTALRLEPGGSFDLTVRFIPGKYGHFTCLLKTSWKERGPGFRAAGVAVVRPPHVMPGGGPDDGFKPNSPYLAPIPARTRRDGDVTPLELARRLGVKWVRGHLPIEAVVAKPNGEPKPEEGEYDWTGADRLVGALRRNRLLLEGELMGYGPLPHPRIGARPVTYAGGRRTNFVVRPEDFDRWASFVEQMVRRYGDVMRAGIIRNEPWESGSVSNYHATAAYFRKVLGIAREAAKKANREFLIVAADQITNFEDSIAMASSSHLVDVTSHHTSWTDNRGAVQSRVLGKPAWETKDWSSHYDAFVIANLTMKLAGGYEKSNPVESRAIFFDHGRKTSTVSPAPQAQAISTWLHFVEDTDFDSEIRPRCLPHVALFRGREKFPQKHVAVVIGRIKLYGRRFAKTDGDAAWPQITGFGHLRLEDPEWVLKVYDMGGNRLARGEDGSYDIPLTEDAYYVTSGVGPFHLAERLFAARARYDGHVFHASLHDFTRPLAERPPVRVTVKNGIQAEVNARVALAAPEGWELETTELLLTAMKPGEARACAFRVRRVKESPANSYRFRVTVSSRFGTRAIEEDLHVAVFVRGRVTVDGDLADWEEAGAVPVTLDYEAGLRRSGSPLERAAGETGAVEKYWFPFSELKDLKPTGKRRVFCRFAGLWDENNFYLAAEVYDAKDRDAKDRDATGGYRPSMWKGIYYLTHGKPLDYLYWWGPRSPGSAGDGLKIAFDLYRPGEKNDPWIPPESQKGIDTRFNNLSADYEYDLYLGAQNRLKESYEKVKARHLERLANPPNRRYKGKYPPFEDPTFETAGPPVPEVWRLMAPGVPRHNYYPFSPRRERDQGLVGGAKLVVRHKRRHKRDARGSYWTYEAAIPWAELAEVKPEAGREVRFSFYVLSGGRRALSWTRNRSACKGYQVLHPTWRAAEAIETRWGFVERLSGAARQVGTSRGPDGAARAGAR